MFLSVDEYLNLIKDSGLKLPKRLLDSLSILLEENPRYLFINGPNEDERSLVANIYCLWRLKNIVKNIASFPGKPSFAFVGGGSLDGLNSFCSGLGLKEEFSGISFSSLDYDIHELFGLDLVGAVLEETDSQEKNKFLAHIKLRANKNRLNFYVVKGSLEGLNRWNISYDTYIFPTK